METELNQKVIVIMGPTAVGKTKISLDVAKEFQGEIISGDSMQIYKGMDIGTAKIKPSEMKGVPHHLIDIKEPEESFSVAEFQSMVREKIADIHKRGSIPIIVGGTGLYIQAVLFDYHFSDVPGDPIFRSEMEDKVRKGESSYLYQQLEKLDPVSAKKIHPNNYRRVIRALEIYHCTGKTTTELQGEQDKSPLYNAILIVLTMEREKLYQRINRRVDMMIEEGLIEEVKRLYQKGLSKYSQSMKAIGYKEIYEFLEGNLTQSQAVEQLKKNSRNYAKRQLTWFRNKMDAVWFDMAENGEDLLKTAQIIDFIAGKLKIKSNT